MIDLNSITLDIPLTDEQILEIFAEATRRVERLEANVERLESRLSANQSVVEALA